MNAISRTPAGASPFATAYLDVVSAGYSPLAIQPGHKRPGSYLQGRWCPAAGWSALAHAPADDATLSRMASWPNAGIGVVLGTSVGDHIVIALDFDTTDESELAALRAAVPESPMVKVGARGETAFYRAEPSIVSHAYKIDGRGILDVLAKGRQTVMPPTIHPDGMAYAWKYGHGLTTAEDLPFFSLDDLAALEGALGGLGYVNAIDVTNSLPSVAQAPSADLDDGEVTLQSVNRRLNNVALARFDSWVADLGLPKTQRTGSETWEAVPTWRASNENRPTMQRKSNLKFHREGIADFGDGKRGYTATDVVMHARGLTQNDAFGWLDERVRAFPGCYDGECGDLALMEANSARRAEAKRADAARAQASRASGVVTWDDREANAAGRMDWLVKGLFPRVGVSLLWGQSGSGKSFVALDLAASVASGTPFFGHRVKSTGGTLFALGEGAGSMPDRLNALRIGRFGGEAPADPDTGELMHLDRLPIGWLPIGDLAKPAAFRVFAEHMRREASEMPARIGTPLRLVVIDTVVASFGFPEDPDASAVTAAMKALDALAQELGVLIVAVHHAGKAKQAGEHGSYAWRGSAETSIQVDAERNEATGAVEKRRVFVRKNRHGSNEGWNRPFELATVELAIDEDGDPVTSCVVKPFDGAVGETTEINAMKPRERDFLAAFQATLDIGCGEMIPTPDGEMLAVLALKIRSQYSAMHPGGDESKRKACERGRKDAIESGRVKPAQLGQALWLYRPAPLADNDNNAA